MVQRRATLLFLCGSDDVMADLKTSMTDPVVTMLLLFLSLIHGRVLSRLCATRVITVDVMIPKVL